MAKRLPNGERPDWRKYKGSEIRPLEKEVSRGRNDGDRWDLEIRFLSGVTESI